MMAKPMKTLELYNLMIGALIINDSLHVSLCLLIFTLFEVILKLPKCNFYVAVGRFFFRPLDFKTEQINEMSNSSPRRLSV